MDLLDGLDPSQHRAVTSSAAPLCIVAGAGSGKTRVLTRRIAHRIATNEADPAHVLVLTFTRKAGAELRRRWWGLGVRDQVAAGTFHSVAYAQLRRRWADAGQLPPALLPRKARILRSIVQLHDGERLADLAAEIDWAKARALTPAAYEEAATRARRRPPRGAGHVAEVYEQYEAEKRRRGVLDLDDLLGVCAEALERDPAFAAAQRWRFRHLFVDEFQDVNPAQLRLLQGWLGDRSDLCVVGDPNQAISAWNGASPAVLTGFVDQFPGAEVIRLEANHRSTPEVVAAAAAVLGSTGGTGRATRPEGSPPSVRRYETDLDEAAGIARAVRDSHPPGTAWSAVAVLARTNAQLVPIEAALRAAGIPVRQRSAFLDHPDVKTALSDLRRPNVASLPLTAVLSDIEAMAAEEGADEERRTALLELVRLGREHVTLDERASPAGFGAWLASCLRGDGDGPGANAVELATFHRAKGLEWPVVFLAGLEEGFVPIAGAHERPDLEDEERRLFYVAITRAVDRLACSWAATRTFGDRAVARQPSPWLALVEHTAQELRPAPPPDAWRDQVAASRQALQAAAARAS